MATCVLPVHVRCVLYVRGHSQSNCRYFPYISSNFQLRAAFCLSSMLIHYIAIFLLVTFATFRKPSKAAHYRCLHSSKLFVKLLVKFTSFDPTSTTSFKISVKLNQHLRTTNKLQVFLQQLQMYSAVDAATHFCHGPKFWI